MNLPPLNNCKIAIIGLGYVGLPLAVAFAKNENCKRTNNKCKRSIIGFDIDHKRIDDLKQFVDITNELTKEQLAEAKDINFTSEISELNYADIFIVTVPTPIDDSKSPDLKCLKKATKTIAQALKNRQKINKNCTTAPIVIYESTVYPGVTNEICVPILEEESDLIYNSNKSKEGFACGYSPERINPGDKIHNLDSIVKVTSGSTKQVSEWVDNLYGSIISAGTYKVDSIIVAEAAKVIENTQRDINIALINELAIIFRKLHIDTYDVLEAAGSKWNFLKYKPGLVGGHCIGVDPYYLTFKAEKLGYRPEMILSGRRLNDEMAHWLSKECILEMVKRSMIINNSNALVLGFTFKEDCPDIRNTKVIDLVDSLKSYGLKVDVFDPIADTDQVRKQFGLSLLSEMPIEKKYSIVIGAVAHSLFMSFKEEDYNKILLDNSFCFDIKSFMPRGVDTIRI